MIDCCDACSAEGTVLILNEGDNLFLAFCFNCESFLGIAETGTEQNPANKNFVQYLNLKRILAVTAKQVVSGSVGRFQVEWAVKKIMDKNRPAWVDKALKEVQETKRII